MSTSTSPTSSISRASTPPPAYHVPYQPPAYPPAAPMRVTSSVTSTVTQTTESRYVVSFADSYEGINCRECLTDTRETCCVIAGACCCGRGEDERGLFAIVCLWVCNWFP